MKIIDEVFYELSNGEVWSVPSGQWEELREHFRAELLADQAANPTPAPEPDWSQCLPEGWELRYGWYSADKWYVFNPSETHCGGYDTPQQAIGETMRKYRELWLKASDD